MAAQGESKRREASITKRTPVREALGTAGTEALTVQEGDNLTLVAERLISRPEINTVPVVDSRGRLVGIIPTRLLLDELFLEVAPEEFLAELKAIEDVEEFGRISRARTAGELMEEPAYVTMDHPVREAFARMHERNLDGLPIVDADMKVVAYLDRLQLIQLWVRRYRRGRE